MLPREKRLSCLERGNVNQKKKLAQSTKRNDDAPYNAKDLSKLNDELADKSVNRFGATATHQFERHQTGILDK